MFVLGVAPSKNLNSKIDFGQMALSLLFETTSFLRFGGVELPDSS